MATLSNARFLLLCFFRTRLVAQRLQSWQQADHIVYFCELLTDIDWTGPDLQCIPKLVVYLWKKWTNSLEMVSHNVSSTTQADVQNLLKMMKTTTMMMMMMTHQRLLL
jgi:hypothetical protein